MLQLVVPAQEERNGFELDPVKTQLVGSKVSLGWT
jgi:hypothetical protein